MKSFKVTTTYGQVLCRHTTTCTMTAGIDARKSGHIALQLWGKDGPFATLTTNPTGLRGLKRNVSCVDTNNCPWAPALIKRLGIGKPTGHYVYSGFCAFPVYSFDIDKVREICGKIPAELERSEKK